MRRIGFAAVLGEPWRIAAALACVVILTGCATAHVVHVPRATTDTPCVRPDPDEDLLVGVALSGGGSRAALFGSAGLEALATLRTEKGASLLTQVSHLSSVSGGSLAAGYFAINRPGREVAVLTPEGTVSEPYQAFFAKSRVALSQDFETELLWLNSALAAKSLFEVLNKRLLAQVRMSEISSREARGDSPRLIINTTLYNNGRRLAFTTLPPEAFRYDYFQDLRRSLAEQGKPTEIPAPLRKRWETLVPMTALEIRMDPCPVRVAGGVTASASFPPLVGPITLQVGGEETYWHAGDGGLYENQGIESLLFVFLKKLQEKTARRALIVAFDSSFPFSVGDQRLNRRAQPWSLLDFDFARIPSIMEERATAYQALFFRSLQIEGVFPGERTLRVFLLRHMDARWREDLSDLPPACRSETPALQSPAEVTQRIAEIPTRFHVASECDRQLLATAAAKLVTQHRQQILDFAAERSPVGAGR
jgi:Patatin-like phospholipase